MKLLVSSIDDVEEMLSNKSYRLSVWREMEERLSFLQALEDTEKPSREEKFKKMLTGGLDLLGALFRERLVDSPGGERSDGVGDHWHAGEEDTWGGEDAGGLWHLH